MHLSKSKTRLKPSYTAAAATRFGFEAIGTRWTIDLYTLSTKAEQEELLAAIRQRIDDYDRNYSRFRSDSLVTRMSKAAGTYTLPPDGKKLFDLYRQLYDITSGKITPLIGGLLSDAGYDANYSLAPGELRQVPGWEDALDYAFPYLTMRQPVILDVGAAGKGYLADIIASLLEDKGVRNYCVNAGGDMAAHMPGGQQLHVGLEHPDNPGLMVGIAGLEQGSICGSAGNRRAWRGFHHIMDPDARRSPEHIKAVWVYAESALLADALSTCLFFVPAQELAAHFTFEYAIVYRDDSLERSARFPAQFFTTESEGGI